jgi:hypothetical protein
MASDRGAGEPYWIMLKPGSRLSISPDGDKKIVQGLIAHQLTADQYVAEYDWQLKLEAKDA